MGNEAEYDEMLPMSKETEAQIATFFLSAPLLAGGAELLGMGLSSLLVGAVGGALVALASGKLIAGGDEQALAGIQIPKANWHALFQTSEAIEAEASREAAEPAQAVAAEPEQWDESWYGDDTEEIALPPGLSGSMFTFSQVLESGFVPSLSRIFLGRLPDGTDIFVPAKDLCHVALAGNTGGGKGAMIRMLMAQLCKIKVPVLLLNPHYMQYDREQDEDWTPYEPYLQQPPLACKSYAQIEFYLNWMAHTLLPRRIERCAKGGRVGKPYFIVIDELPSIVAEVKNAPKYLAKILREGRKYGIFLISASQDFLVETVAADGEGAVRKCYRTAAYVGGDPATAKTLLNMKPADIPENDLGKGVAIIRCETTNNAVLARVPYVDNASLYRLLGPSTFVQEDIEDEPASLPTSQASGVATSSATSIPTSPAPMPEVARSGVNPGTKWHEVAGPLRQISEREKRIGDLFFVEKKNLAAVMREIFPEVKGGEPYQKAAAEVSDAIRTYMEAKTGGEA